MGELGFRHGMTPAHIKEIKRLEKENSLLKQLLAEKEIEGHLKDEMIKKKYAWAREKRTSHNILLKEMHEPVTLLQPPA